MWYNAPPAHDERDARCLNRNATTQINEFSTLYKEAKKSKNPELEIAANEPRTELENFNGLLIGEIQFYDIKDHHHIIAAQIPDDAIFFFDDYGKKKSRSRRRIL